jgi:hypothetical protein
MADMNTALIIAPSAGLLWAPVFTQQGFDQHPTLVLDTELHFTFAPSDCKALGLFGTVSSQTTISPNLAADCGLVNAQYLSNSGLILVCFHQGVNLVSLFLGKQHVDSHLRSSFLSVVEAAMLPQFVF